MLKYFNENLPVSLHERYLDDYRQRCTTDIEEKLLPRSPKIAKIADVQENSGTEGGGGDRIYPSSTPPFPPIKLDEDNLVASWLQNSFKMTASATINETPANPSSSALDLRATPLSLNIPAIQTEANRIKMEWWNRAAGSRPQSTGSAVTPQQGDCAATTTSTAQQTHNDAKVLTEKLVNEIQPEESPSAESSTSDRSTAPFALVNFLQSISKLDPQALSSLNQPQSPQSASGGEASSQERNQLPFTLANVINSLNLDIFMHKNAMQMHARELQRGLSGVSSSLSGEIKPHQCQQCLKSFSSNHQLVQHIRVHTGEKPYKCSYCDRRFKQLSHVQQHTRLHTGERPYKCHLPECGRAFIQLSNLQQHLRNHDAQVERAKNRPFHCNICGKGFATESSLRTHTTKEIQLHLGVLQQHAALMIGGANATPCPICHKVIFGSETLMEHMKNTHKDPNASGVATPPDTSPYPQPALQSATPTQSKSTPTTDSYLAKRRTANHPCPVCGKHYVNEGSLRKHLACHPETQLATGLRMWPCSVCQAVFTHESGLLSHMEHMRMEPKHQFAAQYVLSRAAAERRERDLLAAAVTAGGSGMLMPPQSPSALSESSSIGGAGSSAESESQTTVVCPTKFSELLRNANNGHSNNQYSDVAAIAAAAANMMSQQPNDSAVQAAAAGLAAAMRLNSVAQLQRDSTAPSTQPTSPQAAGNPTTASETALRIQQAEALLRSQAEAAIRLAVSQATTSVENSSPHRHNNGGFTQQSQSETSPGQLSPQLAEALRLAQEQRLEQALRLHADPRLLGFNLPSPVQTAAQQAVHVAQQAAQQAAQQVQQQQLTAAAASHHAVQQAVHLQQNPQQQSHQP